MDASQFTSDHEYCDGIGPSATCPGCDYCLGSEGDAPSPRYAWVQVRPQVIPEIESFDVKVKTPRTKGWELVAWTDTHADAVGLATEYAAFDDEATLKIVPRYQGE